MLRPLIAGLVVVVSVGALSIGIAPSAGACTCASTTDQAAMARADAAFSGVLIDVVSMGDERFAPRDRERLVFDVQDVFKGRVTETQTVVTPRHGASCGLEISGHGPWLVFAYDDPRLPSGGSDGELHSHLCSGTRALDARAVPAGFVSTPPAADPAATSPRTGESPTAVVGGGEGTQGWSVAVAAAVSALVAGAIWWWSRTRSGDEPVT